MRLTVLGSGTLLPDDRHRSAAHLVEPPAPDAGDGWRLLLDCGYGTVHGFARHGVHWAGITHVALTHFHPDHAADLVPLLFATRNGLRPRRTRRLTLLGPPGLGVFLDAQAAAFGEFVRDPGFPLAVVEVALDGSWEAEEAGFGLRTCPTHHTDRSVAYRVETAEGSVGYTGDTGADPRLAGFFAGVDVLVAECSLVDPPAMDTHLSPRRVAELARGSGVDLLVLTHVYPELERARLPDLVRAAGYGGRVVVPEDGVRIEVGTSPVSDAGREG